MLKQAVRELRFHPTRFVATLVAIAISVGFMAGVSSFVTTLRDALARGETLPLTHADIVVTGSPQLAKIAKMLGTQAGVSKVSLSDRSLKLVRAGGEPHSVTIRTLVAEPFQWTSISEGRWPANAREVALSNQAMALLKLSIGSSFSFQGESTAKLVVGVTTEPQLPTHPTGISGDTSGSELLVKAAPGVGLQPLVERLQAVAHSVDASAVVQLASDARAAAVKGLTDQFDVTKYMLQGFAVVSLLVGTIIIANTFNILLAQRRRQIGLLRAVGASGLQIRSGLLTESLLLGLLGSTVGIGLGLGSAWIGASIMEMTHWGLSIPWVELLIVFLIGTGATVAAASGASFRATQVSPMEALRSVPTEDARRITTIRLVVCTVTAVLGATATVLSQVLGERNLAYGMAAGVLITITVLGAAPVFVPVLIEALGKLFSFAGPVVRLAAANGARNPQRTAATATALMLAMGLIVTLQVGTSTVRSTALAKINKDYPVDITAYSAQNAPVPQGFIKASQQIPGVATAVPIPGFLSGHYSLVLAPGDAMTQVAPKVKLKPPPAGTAYVHETMMPAGQPVMTIVGPKAKLTFKLERTRFASGGAILVNPADLAKLTDKTATMQVWYALQNRNHSVNALTALIDLGAAQKANLHVEGAAVEARNIERIANLMLLAMSALLSVAVVIALVGVANTLGLSVIERQRESALLRALGMQRVGLRAMLLVEALMIALIGSAVGIVAGAFFGWLGTKTALREGNRVSLVYSIDPLSTSILIAVATVAAGLASILPGRRAALATPTEALADE